MEKAKVYFTDFRTPYGSLSMPQKLQKLIKAAGILEQDLQSKLEKFRELFAPVLLLIAALLTALVVCSVMGPLFDLFTALPEYE